MLRTDHALMRLPRFKNPEQQVARWIERLQQYDFDLEHRSGTNHRNADELSRRSRPKEYVQFSQEKAVETCMRVTIIKDS